jgi:hypothetical protein
MVEQYRIGRKGGSRVEEGDWTDLSTIYLQVKYQDKIPTEKLTDT